MPSYSEEFRAKVCDAYCLGHHVSVESVARDFKISPRLIWTWIDKYGWRAVREEVAAKAEKARIENIAQERAKLDRIYLSLWTKFLTAAKDMIGIVIADRDAKGLAALSTVVRRAQDGHRIVLGIPDEEQTKATEDERLAELSEEELEKEIDRLRDEILAEAGDRPAASPAARKAAAAGGE